jgi:hypothetical protein
VNSPENTSRSTSHVCLISEQPIPNLIPLLLEKPVKAVFLVSAEMSAQAERLKKVLQPRSISVEIAEISSAYDFMAVERICKQIIEGHEAGNGLTLNVTGGTKITALAAFQVFYFNDHRIIYLDTTNKQLLQLAPESDAIPVRDNLVKVRDYLHAYGMNPEDIPDSGKAEGRLGLDGLAQLLVGNEVLLSKLNAALDGHGKKPSYANLTLNELGDKAEDLAACLVDCGVASQISAGGLNISSREKLFFCQGGWLEEYVFKAVKSLAIKGLDLAMNVRVRWDGKGRKQTENEFDVLFTHCNRLHIVSCKASNPERITETGTRATEALNELDTLSDRAGGLFGRAMLVSARRLSDYDRERGRKMKVEIVDGRDVLYFQKRLRAWLKI